MTPTEIKLKALQDAWTRYFIAQRDYPGLANPEPKADDFGVSEWVCKNVKREVERDCKRKI